MDNVYIKMLYQAYPFLKKRCNENPEPDLVDIVTKIEQLKLTENKDEFAKAQV